MLADIEVRKAKGRDRPYKMFDENGLCRLVAPSAVSAWRFKYRFGGKEQDISFGVSRSVSLSEARRRCVDARALVRDGLNPSAERRRRLEPVLAVQTFENVARNCHKLHLPKWQTQLGANVLQQLVNDVFPSLGANPIVEINSPMVLATVRAIEDRGAIDTARRPRQRMSAIFAYCIASGQCTDDSAAIRSRARRKSLSRISCATSQSPDEQHG